MPAPKEILSASFEAGILFIDGLEANLGNLDWYSCLYDGQTKRNERLVTFAFLGEDACTAIMDAEEYHAFMRKVEEMRRAFIGAEPDED